ncbi:MAG: flagellar biosynthesis anti-sigma factor FlgM [Nitrospirae bacterium]|nr:flagellar biosynthesis anti-sigma factor FlgM [Nitrospirota bacterium]
MKIFGNKPPDPKEVVSSPKKADKGQSSQDSVGAEKVSQSDRVSLSSTAKGLDDMKQAIRQMPDVREDKVRAISGSIDNGTYKIDSSAIADKMMQEM